MFDNYAMLNTSYANPTVYQRPGQGSRPQFEAAQEFNRALAKGRLGQVWAAITRQSNRRRDRPPTYDRQEGCPSMCAIIQTLSG